MIGIATIFRTGNYGGSLQAYALKKAIELNGLGEAEIINYCCDSVKGKIDMKFLGKSEDDKKADTIVKNIINLSRELGITSLTEGVETINQYDGLSQMGCKLFQGYYFSKPIPIKDFEDLVDRNKEAV